MMVTLRLYRQHDLDLITLYRHPSFSLPNAMKTALCAYVRNEQFYIKQPAPYELGNEKIAKIVQMHIQLTDSEKDVISWLKNIKEGYRNSVLKNVIRSYMAGPCIYSYVQDSNTGMTQAGNVIDSFEDNIKKLAEIKGRGYKKSKIKKVDTRKVEDSELAKTILSGKKENNAGNVFVERIDDDNVDIKALEKITQVDDKSAAKKQAVEEKIEEQPVKQTEKPIGKIADNVTSKNVPPQPQAPEPVEEEDAGTLDDMLDDIDAMMDGL